MDTLTDFVKKTVTIIVLKHYDNAYFVYVLSCQIRQISTKPST